MASGNGRTFSMRTPEEVRLAVQAWANCMEKNFDEDFGLCLLPEKGWMYSVERWGHRLGERISPRGYHGVSQDSTYYGMTLLHLGDDLERARKIVTRVLEAQVKDKESHRYGEFKLVYEAAGDDVLDGNTTFFVSLALLPMVMEFPDRLGDELTARVKEALALIPPKTYERDLGVGYTNRCFGELGMCLSIAEMAQDKEMFEVNRQRFDYFYEVNMERGFPERLTMTYYMVDIAGLCMILKYVSDPAIRMRAREMLAIIAQDLFFFDDRQPAPARRTYNQDFGAAAKWSLLEWLMGIVPWDAETVEEQNNAGGPHGFLPDGGWMALCDVLVRGVLDANDFALPAPRQMRGRFVDELGYTSYFHKDFVLGTFDRWQPLTVYKQHESDIPVAFEGAARDLVYFGAYSIDAEDALKTHPGTGKVGMPSKTSLPTLTYAAAQEANVCCLLTNIRGFSCDLKEYGWMLRGLQYQGKLFNKEGCELTGKGTVENEWVFLATEDYFTGVCPLTRFDPTHKNLLESLPTSLHYEFSDNGLFITAPNFKVDTPIEVKGDNLPGGAILVLGSAKDGDLDAFRSACLACTIEDEWYVDGFLTREGNRDCERRIGISAPGAELRLAFDYRRDQVVHRSFNGRPIKTPLELSAVRIGVHPWGVPMA